MEENTTPQNVAGMGETATKRGRGNAATRPHIHASFHDTYYNAHEYVHSMAHTLRDNLTVLIVYLGISTIFYRNLSFFRHISDYKANSRARKMFTWIKGVLYFLDKQPLSPLYQLAFLMAHCCLKRKVD